MRKYIVVFLFLLGLCPFYTSGQQRMLFASNGRHVQEKFVKDNSLTKVTLIYQSEFIKNNKFDYELLERNINRKIPKANETGYAVLDWEGEAMAILTQSKQVSKKLHSKTIKNFIEAIECAKKLRPRMKWSYYGLPNRNYWSITEAWKSKNFSLMPLFEKMDFIAPSLYTLYLPEEVSLQMEKHYIEENVRLALEIAYKHNIEVYPFIWHKNNTPKKNKKFSLLKNETLEFYISTILNVNYNTKKVNGVVWWNSESYDFSTGQNKHLALREQYANVKNFETYEYELFQSYYDVIKKYFK